VRSSPREQVLDRDVVLLGLDSLTGRPMAQRHA